MSTARDFLAAVQQRADQRVGWPAMSPEKAGALVDALTDRRRLVAALTAALDAHPDLEPIILGALHGS